MSQNSETPSNSDAPKGTILIIDDNPTNLGVITEYFELFGFTILIARDGESGLEKAHYDQPDLILLDVMMPGIDGFETCRRLKASEITQDIPVIFLTALANVEEKIKGFEVGGVDYVVKPLHQKEILARVTTHLRLRTLTQELQQELAKRKRVEQELQHSLKEIQNVRFALDEHSIVAITDQQGLITYVNDKFCEISNYSREELLGQDHRLVNSGYHAKEFMGNLWTTLINGQVWKGQIKNRAKDGAFYWVDTTITPFLNEQDKLYQYVAISTAVTEPAAKEKPSKKKSANDSLEFLLNKRVKELNCLNEISREIADAPPVPELLQWVTERIPPAMRYPELCVTAIEYADQIYGVPEAVALPGQITHALRLGNTVIGRIYISYSEKRDFLNEESALIGGIAGRLGGYIESRHLLEQTKEAQAESELLYRMANQLIQAADPTDLLEAASGYARSLGASAAQLMYLDTDPQGNPEWANMIAQWQLSGEPLAMPTRFYLPEFPMSKLWISQPDQPLLISNILTDQAIDPLVREMLVQGQAHSFGLLPLNIKGRWVGLLSFSWTEPYQFTERDQRIFSALAKQTVALVDAIKASAQMQAALAENKQRATEFEETNHFLDSIIENMPIGIFVKRAEDLSFVEWNPAYEKMFGLKKEAVLGKNDSDFFSPEEADFFSAKDREVLAAGKMLDIPEESVETAHAGTRFLHTRKVPIFGADGQPKYLLGITEDITEHKQAADKLRENEQRYQQILDAITDMILVKGPKSKIVWANKAFRDYYGMTIEQLSDMIDAPFNEPDYTQQYVKDDAYVFESGKVLNIPEEPVTRFDGVVHLFHTVKSPIFDAEGQIVMTVGVSRDTSEHKQTEAILKENQARLSETLKIAQLAYWEFDLETQNLTLNDQFYSILKTTAEREDGYVMPVAKFAEKFVYPEDIPKIGAEVQKLMETDDPDYSSSLEYRLTRANGEAGYVGVQLKKEPGSKVKVAGIFQDITERKQVEATLQENQRLLRGFIDNSDAIIFVKDIQGRYFLVNDRFETLFHVDKHEVVGKTDLDIFPKELAKELRANDLKMIEARVSSQVEESVVFDDGPHTFLSLKFPFLDAAGVPYALGGISTDITEKNRAELEREQLLVEVEAAYRKYVRQEWNQFLGEQHQGSWHVEHQTVSQPIEPVTQALNKLQDEVIREGKVVVAGAGGNGHKVEPTIMAPIILRGQVIGTFSLQDIDPERQWSTEEMALVETVSEQLGLTIENLRLFDDTQKQATREQLTRQIADKMRAASDVESIIQTGLTELGKALGVSRSYVKLTPKE